MEFDGTSAITTALAPMATSSPTWMGPSTLAPAPMSARLPMTGAPRWPVMAQADGHSVPNDAIVAENGVAR